MKDLKTLYEVTGDIKDVNTLLVNRKVLEGMTATPEAAMALLREAREALFQQQKTVMGDYRDELWSLINRIDALEGKKEQDAMSLSKEQKEAERVRFEAWCEEQSFDTSKWLSTAAYENVRLNDYWDGWQARALIEHDALYFGERRYTVILGRSLIARIDALEGKKEQQP